MDIQIYHINKQCGILVYILFWTDFVLNSFRTLHSDCFRPYRWYRAHGRLCIGKLVRFLRMNQSPIDAGNERRRESAARVILEGNLREIQWFRFETSDSNIDKTLITVRIHFIFFLSLSHTRRAVACEERR